MRKRQRERQLWMGKEKQRIAAALFSSAQLTMARAWSPFLFNVKVCAGSDKTHR